jgi:phage protein U
MFAQLGDVVFDLVGAVQGLDAQHGFTYAEHAVIAGRPRLQAIGAALQRISVDLQLVYPIVQDPAASVRALRVAMEAHQALPLLFAGGELRGRFVIEAIEETVVATDSQGTPKVIRGRVQLVEWVEDQAQRTVAPTPRAEPTATRSQQNGRAHHGTSSNRARGAGEHRKIPIQQISRRQTWAGS